MTAPVAYGNHAAIESGTTCSTCHAVPARPVVDHCHRHGWVRGPLCGKCNTAMAYVDRRMTPKAALLNGNVSLAALIAHAGRCHECPQLGASDLGPTSSLRPPSPPTGGPTTARFRAHINAAIREVADEMGVSFNAALSVLVTEALRARGRRPSSAATDPSNKATHD